MAPRPAPTPSAASALRERSPLAAQRRVLLGFGIFSALARIVGAGLAALFAPGWLVPVQLLGVTLHGALILLGRGRDLPFFLGAFGLEWALWGLSMATWFGVTAAFHIHASLMASGILLLLHEVPPRMRLLLFVLPLLVPLAFVELFRTVDPVMALSPTAVETAAVLNHQLAIAFLAVVAGLAMLDHARARRQAEERAEAEAQLVEDLSHELRTPIATILATAQGARLLEDLPRTIERDLERIEGSARSSGLLVERMLDLAELDRGEQAASRPTVDLASRVAEIVERARPVAAEKDLDLRLRIEGDPSRAVDPAALEIVLQNLLSNAFSHSPPGGRVDVRCVSEGARTRIEVEDLGDGIAPEDLPRVFDRMWRADRSRARAERRHGLGLAIARRHAEAMGASLTVASTPGRGSVFSVRFDGSA